MSKGKDSNPKVRISDDIEFGSQGDLFQLFFENASLGLNICRMDGTWVDSNPALCKIIGYNRQDCISGLTYRNLTHRIYDEQDKLQLARLSSTGRYGPYEKEFIKKDGSLVPVRLNGFIIEKSGEKFIWSVIEDLSGLKKLEQNLEVKNRELEQLALGLNKSAIVAITDQKGTINFANELFCNISGYSLKEIIGQNHRILNSGFHPPEFFQQMWKTISAGKTWHAEICNRRKDGSLYWVDTTITQSIGQKGESQYLAIRFDITDKKASEQSLLNSARLITLGEVSAGIAHEINNPLAVIQGSADLILKLKDSPELLKKKVETIYKSCHRISRIISSLKRVSYIDDKSNYAPSSLNNILKESLILTETKSKINDTPITAEYRTDTQVLCDEIEIEQVFVNLINNAIDAVKNNEEKWVKASVFEDKNSVVVRITDSGQGIAKNLHSKIFSPFFTTKKMGEGTGLGLSITKKILDQHKATINIVADSPNTCFELRFPKLEQVKKSA